MTNIIHFSETDFGGAGSSALKMHQMLSENGFKGIFFCKDKKSNNKDIVIIKPKLKNLYFRLIKVIEDKFNFFKRDYYYFDRNRNIINDISQVDQYISFHPDIIMLHWISGFVSLKVIKQLSKKYNCKVFWQALDMSPMTGGCHYAWRCSGYTNDCKNCPAVGSIFKNLPSINLNYKKKMIKEINIEPISCTSWLTKQLKSSKLFKDTEIHKIMLGVNLEIFKPLSEEKVTDIKLKYNLPTDKKIIFIGASDVLENRKGFSYFIEAMNLIFENNLIDKNSIIIMSAGNNKPKDILNKIKFNHRHIGYLDGDCELAEAYQMATMFVSSSIEDSGPLMINESIMCGTPVVSFDMGVAKDLVINGETGYIAELRNIKDLANGIIKVINLENQKFIKMKKKCREIGLKKSSTELQLQKFITLTEQ